MKRAWVTLLSDNHFINGLVGLAYSLNKVNTIYPLYCIVTPNITEENLKVISSLGVNIIKKPFYTLNNYQNAPTTDMTIIEAESVHVHLGLSKLYVTELQSFDKIVCLDTDILVRKNMDELFEWPHMSAIRDEYSENKKGFCTGLFVFEPKQISLNEFKEFVINYTATGNVIGDQNVLNAYYYDWWKFPDREIPVIYNRWSSHYDNYVDIDIGIKYHYNKDDKSIHFVYKKPWELGSKIYMNQLNDYPRYAITCLEYINYLNECIKDLNNHGVYSSNLKYIE